MVPLDQHRRWVTKGGEISARRILTKMGSIALISVKLPHRSDEIGSTSDKASAFGNQAADKSGKVSAEQLTMPKRARRFELRGGSNQRGLGGSSPLEDAIEEPTDRHHGGWLARVAVSALLFEIVRQGQTVTCLGTVGCLRPRCRGVSSSGN